MGKRLATYFEQRPGLAVIGLIGLFCLLTGVVTIEPQFVSLAVGVPIASAWCWWLETSHGAGADDGTLSGREAARKLADSRGRARSEELAISDQPYLTT